MSLPLSIKRVSFGFIIVASCSFGLAQGFESQGNEFQIVPSLQGDQVNVSAAVNASGGLVVWEDSFTDGDGLGISGRRLDSSLSGVFSTFRVNVDGVGNQRKPDVALLGDGGAVVVWQSDHGANGDIYLRAYSAGFTNYGGDVLVNTHTLDQQEDPAVTALDNGDFIVVWSSYNEATPTSMKDVYLRRFGSTGAPLGDALLVNQETSLNQRNPDVAGLDDGTFVVVWIGETRELVNGTNEVYDVDVMARHYSSVGVPIGNEYKVNTSQNPCANPNIARGSGGGFAVAWSQKDLASSSNSWDIVARTYASSGGAGSVPAGLNTHLYGDQFRPKLEGVGGDYFCIWTSLAQDGSHEGVFGRFMGASGTTTGAEVRVNTTFFGKQILPALATDGNTRFLAVWSSFNGIAAGFDLFAQRYASTSEPLVPPDAPFVWALGFSEISVAWPELAGFDVASYQVHVDESATPSASATNNQWTLTNAAPHSTHTFRLAYVLEDGRTSPLSDSASATTYGEYGTITYGTTIPFDWMVANWGLNLASWPDAGDDSDGDGASNEDEFLAGTDPKDPNSVLRNDLVSTPQGMFLMWNTEPGKIYQVEQSADFKTWSPLGGRRFAAGDVDSVHLGQGGSGLFRVVLLRN